jgi:hypothetical protein
MNYGLKKRLEKLELTRPEKAKRWLIVSAAKLVPAGFDGPVIVTGVPRHGDKLEAA